MSAYRHGATQACPAVTMASAPRVPWWHLRAMWRGVLLRRRRAAWKADLIERFMIAITIPPARDNPCPTCGWLVSHGRPCPLKTLREQRWRAHAFADAVLNPRSGFTHDRL
jgi:hypothetical protein